MRVLRGLDALPGAEHGPGCVATIGVFDGVHLGHFLVFRRTLERASERGLAATVVTFADHPKRVLLGRAPATVTSLAHRLLLFERAGIEQALVLEFTPELRELTAEQFVRRVLVSGLGARELVLGFDSKFGRDRGGTVETLTPLAQELGIELHEVGPLRLGHRAVSSTAIREAVELGELDRAAAMLGRPVSLLGTVIHGDGRGRQIGFPTANLDLHHELRPPRGVYAAFVHHENRLRPAVVNVGQRPTFDGQDVTVEVHLLDFEASLYEQDLEVFFLERLRDERAFSGVEALVDQIRSDVQQARLVLEAAPSQWRIPGRYLPIEGAGPESLRA